MSKDEKILTTHDIAQFLAVSQETVARWCAEGRLPAFKIGGQWRLRSSDLQKMIQQKVNKNFGPLKNLDSKSLFD